MRSVVIGIGVALPEKCVTNDDLSATLDTSDEWISQRTGIRQRHIAGAGETTVSLSAEAAARALDQAKVSPQDIDLTIVGTVTGDYTFPSTAALVQKKLGICGGIAFDLSAACSGFLYGLTVADSLMKCGQVKNALVIGADTFSRILDWTDRSSCILFGDGAGAVVLQAQENTSLGIIYSKTYCDAEYTDILITTGGVSTTQNSGFVTMNGREVFRLAVEKFQSALTELLQKNDLEISDIDFIVPHQANWRIIKKIIDFTGIDEKKVIVTVDKHANTSAASIPLALNEIKNEISSGKNVILLSVGAGLTWGASLIRI